MTSDEQPTPPNTEVDEFRAILAKYTDADGNLHPHPLPTSDTPAPDASEALALAPEPLACVGAGARYDPQDHQLRPNPGSRHDGWTPRRRAAFLRALSADGSVAAAARAAGLSTQSVYALRARDPLFELLWEAALELGGRQLEDALWSRALHGVLEVATRDGDRIIRRRFDNRLALAMLARLDRRAQPAGQPFGPDAAPIVAAAWDEVLGAVEEGKSSFLVTRLIVRARHTGKEQRRRLRAIDRAEQELNEMNEKFAAGNGLGAE